LKRIKNIHSFFNMKNIEKDGFSLDQLGTATPDIHGITPHRIHYKAPGRHHADDDWGTFSTTVKRYHGGKKISYKVEIQATTQQEQRILMASKEAHDGAHERAKHGDLSGLSGTNNLLHNRFQSVEHDPEEERMRAKQQSRNQMESLRPSGFGVRAHFHAARR
jgi:hypothetical protein